VKSQNSNFKKRSFGLQTIEEKMSHLLKPIFQGSKKEFILINNLVKNWSQIVGPKYAKFCAPKMVSFEKNKSGAKLTISVFNSSVGFFLENNSNASNWIFFICSTLFIWYKKGGYVYMF
jgi:hypothetical protein